MNKNDLQQALQQAVRAMQDKKAVDVVLLDMRTGASFTDYFLLCSGTSRRQVQAIGNAVEEQLERMGVPPLHMEGYESAEWVLLDYLNFVVHIFSERARAYYDLERLWRSAHRLPIPADVPPGAQPAERL